MTRGNKRTIQMMHYCEEERPLSIQVYGSRPDRMAEAARIVESIGADVCDINMGCPANKVLKGCAGCALMGDLDLAREIIATVRKAIRIPLTVKFRAGIRDNALNYLELGRICEGEGVDAVASRQLRVLLQRFVEKGGSVFLTSHVLAIVESLCDHVGVIHRGELVAQAPFEELRRGADGQGRSLEELFLELVGAEEEDAASLDWLGA